MVLNLLLVRTLLHGQESGRNAKHLTWRQQGREVAQHSYRHDVTV